MPADCNGCGSKGGWIPVPQFIFTASCDRHDLAYALGGSEARRKECDKGFYAAMKKDASLQPYPLRAWYRVWAFTYYRAVRWFGGRYFNQVPV